MSLVADIVENAFRESALTNELQSATPTQTNQARDRLQNLVSSAYGFEVGEPLVDWPVGLEGVQLPSTAAWVQQQWERPAINARLIAASSSAQTVYLPMRPYDGSRIALIDPASRLAAAPITLDGNGRTIDGATTAVVNTNGVQKIYFYRADLGDWVSLTPLTLTGEFPFPPEFDDYFITSLAMRLNPRYGRSMTQESVAALQRSLSMLQARYRQSEIIGVDAALVALSPGLNGSRWNNGTSPQTTGDRGWMI